MHSYHRLYGTNTRMHICKVHNHTFASERLQTNLTEGCFLLIHTILYHSTHLQSVVLISFYTGDKRSHISPSTRSSKCTEVNTKPVTDARIRPSGWCTTVSCMVNFDELVEAVFSQVLFHTNLSIEQRRLIIIYYSPSGNTHFTLGTIQTHQEDSPSLMVLR